MRRDLCSAASAFASSAFAGPSAFVASSTCWARIACSACGACSRGAPRSRKSACFITSNKFASARDAGSRTGWGIGGWLLGWFERIAEDDFEHGDLADWKPERMLYLFFSLASLAYFQRVVRHLIVVVVPSVLDQVCDQLLHLLAELAEFFVEF